MFMEESVFKTSEMLVVLDLDETLVHVTENALPGVAPKFKWDNYFVYTAMPSTSHRLPEPPKTTNLLCC